MVERSDAAPVSRRALLTGGTLSVGGALAGAAVTAAVTVASDSGGTGAAPSARRESGYGRRTEPFHGRHQAGVETPPQAHAAFVAFDLAPGTDRAALRRLLRLLTDDAARLARGGAPLADTQPELALLPARLTVTFGFGPGLFDAVGVADRRPESLVQLPPFGIDRLEPRWCGGDLLVQVCADDPLTVAHAQRMLIKDCRAFTTLRWVQRGFRNSRGTVDDAVTQRNVLGQLDGTANPAPGSPAFAAAVWTDSGPEWLHGGTTLVLRRIRAEMDRWDAVDTSGKEFAVGRRLSDGAPLTGRHERDEPDLAATDPSGLRVISEFSHVARAHTGGERQKIFRRPYNYDEPPAPGVPADTGLIFAAYQRDIGGQYLPIQRNLAEADLLNDWVTPIGSAVFAIPPGCGPGGWIGETLLG